MNILVTGGVISGKKKKETINENPEIDLKAGRHSFQAREILKALSEEIGSIVNELLNTLYNPNYAEKFADGIILVYNKLKKEGLSQEAIERILYEYSRNVDKLIALLRKEEK